MACGRAGQGGVRERAGHQGECPGGKPTGLLNLVTRASLPRNAPHALHPDNDILALAPACLFNAVVSDTSIQATPSSILKPYSTTNSMSILSPVDAPSTVHLSV